MSTHALVALFSLAGLAATAAAQDGAGREGVGSDVPTCQSLSSASRTRSACGEESTSVLSAEKEVTFRLEVAEPDTRYCRAEIALEYSQRNTIAHVEGVIKNEECPASHGEYTIELSVRDGNGESKQLEFDELWQRDDDQPVTFTSDYSIGENVELIRARTRRLRCVCAGIP